jgi:phosphoribosylglycinamide formyltransferase-1
MSLHTPLRIAVLGSGSGSNFQSILDAINNNNLNANVVCVISDVADALIIERAKRYNIPVQFIDPAPYKTKLEGDAEQKYIEYINSHAADIVVLAGFMRIIKHNFLQHFSGRILNIHPSLLPAFPGLYAWKQALDYGVKLAGCTVHFVDEGTDTGPIITQKCVPVMDDDTPESLPARIQIQAHIAYPEAIQKLINGSI